MIKKFVAILGVIFLGACVGPNDRPLEAPKLVELKNASSQKCLAEGYTKGSSEYNR